ncbi:hypothetical protein SPHINGO8BC_80060 [Sphingobacterium multivorum]|uniref:Uncharacterized protein n=1 Tax=Sphingobacterium multivorum TaxID=28454 RepID=A0A654DX09_SPHMU|nr:hypothetical protein SPHINGO8BC_80060 [Sphingobacterium multivorum]
MNYSNAIQIAEFAGNTKDDELLLLALIHLKILFYDAPRARRYAILPDLQTLSLTIGLSLLLYFPLNSTHHHMLR